MHHLLDAEESSPSEYIPRRVPNTLLSKSDGDFVQTPVAEVQRIQDLSIDLQQQRETLIILAYDVLSIQA